MSAHLMRFLVGADAQDPVLGDAIPVEPAVDKHVPPLALALAVLALRNLELVLPEIPLVLPELPVDPVLCVGAGVVPEDAVAGGGAAVGGGAVVGGGVAVVGGGVADEMLENDVSIDTG